VTLTTETFNPTKNATRGCNSTIGIILENSNESVFPLHTIDGIGLRGSIGQFDECDAPRILSGLHNVRASKHAHDSTRLCREVHNPADER